MKKYKIGIIGHGGFGKFLHHWWGKMEQVEIVAISDSHIQQDELKNGKIYREWRELINDPDVEIVSIVTPPGVHAKMACAAMEAGKHVLLEKPVATTEADARQILQTQRETGMTITVDHMMRYNPIIQNLKQLGQSGALGELRHVVVNNYAQDEALPPDHWFWDEEMSGGIFIEHGVHFFDIISAISGQHYDKVFGYSTHRNEGQRDRVAAMVTYKEGLIANYYHAFSGPGLFEQTTVHLAYDLGRIDIEGWMPMKGTVQALVNEQTKEKLASLPGWELTESESLDSSGDESRPEGWGDSENVPKADNGLTYSAGIGYDVSEMVSGTFELKQSKGEVYGACVQDILADLIRKIENMDHKLAITVEDAVTALEIAVRASGKEMKG